MILNYPCSQAEKLSVDWIYSKVKGYNQNLED